MSLRKYTPYTIFCSAILCTTKNSNKYDLPQIISKLRMQGQVVLEVDISKDFRNVHLAFREIISTCVVTKAFVVIVYYSEATDPTHLFYTLGYLRCNGYNILSIDNIVPDCRSISGSNVYDAIGRMSMQYGSVPFSTQVVNVGSLSNSVRFNVLSLVNTLSNTYGSVYYVGWHLLSWYYSLELGMKVKIVDCFAFPKLTDAVKSPFRHACNPDPSRYISPIAEIKLCALVAYVVSKYDTIVVIGGFPGIEFRNIYKYLKNYGVRVHLIDPAFTTNGIVDECYMYNGVWDFESSLHDNLLRLDIHAGTRSVILDDAWIDGDNAMCKLLLNKLKNLIPTNKWDILMKFNWYKTLPKRVKLSYYSDIVLLPGMNDSTESRLLLTFNGRDTNLCKSNYLAMMHGWRTVPLAKQTYYFGCYMLSVIERKNIIDLPLEKGDVIVSLYALGNAHVPFNIGVLKHWHSKGVGFIGNFYTSFNIDEATMMYKEYTDVVYPVESILDLYKNGFYGITFDKLYNWLVVRNTDRVGFIINGDKDVDSVYETIDQLRSRLILMNLPMLHEVLLQTSLFSYGYRLKAISIGLRSDRVISLNSTYIERHRILSAHANDPSALEYSPDKHVVNVLKTCIISNDSHSVDVSWDKHIEMSGHVLNLVLYELIEPGSLALWIQQLRYYYSLLRDDSNVSITIRDSYRRMWNQFAFLEVSSDRVLQQWHTKNDMLLAAMFIPEYWECFLSLNEKQTGHLKSIGDWLFDRIQWVFSED